MQIPIMTYSLHKISNKVSAKSKVKTGSDIGHTWPEPTG